jgi:aryl carrier-like protein
LLLVIHADGIVAFDKIKPDVRKEIIDHLGPEKDVRKFFAGFAFHFDEPSLDALYLGVKHRFLNLGGEENGWLNLRDSMRAWVRDRNSLGPNGKITVKVARHAALWHELDRLPEKFEIPEDYVLPEERFHDQLISAIINQERSCIVVSAPPGLGKSTYLSYLVDELGKKKIPTIRHHYFLSIADKKATIRFEHRRVLESLMGDLLEECPEALGDVSAGNPRADDFLKWIDTAVKNLAGESIPLVIIIDGLDHVFREKSSVEELNALFNYLLPSQKGVIVIVGTQPVDDDRLPSRLLQQSPRADWWTLPHLSKLAVREWLTKHGGELQLPENGTAREYKLDDDADAFYDVSSGHPLVLKYSLRALIERNQLVSATQIKSLPSCPSVEVEDYYRNLWRDLSPESRIVLCLITVLTFPWSDIGIVDTLSGSIAERARFDYALRMVKHLMVRHALGWTAFHKSLYAFVESTDEFHLHGRKLKVRALKWIKELSGLEYIKWAFEWKLEAQLDKETLLIAGPTRQWLIDAMSVRRDSEDADTIMVEAGLKALDSGEIVRYTVIGLLRDYYRSALEYQGDGWQELLEPQLELQEDSTLLGRLAESVDRLADSELLTLGRKAFSTGDNKLLSRIFHTLNDRLATAKQGDEVELLQEMTSRVAALYDGIDSERIVRYISQFRKQNQSIDILQVICNECVRAKDMSRLTSILDLVENLTEEETQVISSAFSLSAVEMGIPLDDLSNGDKITEPISLIAGRFRNARCNRSVPFGFPDSKILDMPAYEHYKIQDAFQNFFYSVFFIFVGNYLIGKGDSNQNWLAEIGEHTWARLFVGLLDDIALKISDQIVKGVPIEFSFVFSEASHLERPSWKEDRDSQYFVISSRFALKRIAFDLIRLQTPRSSPRISRTELEKSLASPYCLPDNFLEAFLGLNRAWLSAEALEWFLEERTNLLKKTVEQFPERALTFARLAKLAMLHGKRRECRDSIRLASANLLSHGNHKDMMFFGVLDSIEKSFDAGITESKSWLIECVPAILAVTDYTDGDETSGLIHELSEALYHIGPELFLRHYQWLLKKEDYSNANSAFHHFLENTDLSKELAKNIALTAVDEESLKILGSRASVGDYAASDICREMRKYLGAIVYDDDRQDQRHTDKSEHGNSSEISAEVHEAKDYPPAKFDDYYSLYSSLTPYDREPLLVKWLEFWKSTSQARQAVAQIRKIGIMGHHDRLLEMIFEETLKYDGPNDAYPWLVQTFCNFSGWQKYSYSDEQIRRYWTIVKDKYGTKWMEFFNDTQYNDYTRSRIVSSAMRFQRFVEYFLYLNQMQLAVDVARACVKFSLSLVSELNLESPDWLPHERC